MHTELCCPIFGPTGEGFLAAESDLEASNFSIAQGLQKKHISKINFVQKLYDLIVSFDVLL